MKVALMGGSFNPPTKDHLRAAQEILRLGLVDMVCFVPAANHPFADEQEHKRDMLSIYDRGEMLWRMISKTEDRHNITVSFLEETRSLSGYTWETIANFKESSPDNEYFWVMGTDCVNDLGKWSRVEYILENVTIIAYPRGGYEPGDGGYWDILRTDHIVLTEDQVAVGEGSSTEARENPDGGLLDSDVAELWKQKTSENTARRAVS